MSSLGMFRGRASGIAAIMLEANSGTTTRVLPSTVASRCSFDFCSSSSSSSSSPPPPPPPPPSSFRSMVSSSRCCDGDADVSSSRFLSVSLMETSLSPLIDSANHDRYCYYRDPFNKLAAMAEPSSTLYRSVLRGGLTISSTSSGNSLSSTITRKMISSFPPHLAAAMAQGQLGYGSRHIVDAAERERERERERRERERERERREREREGVYLTASDTEDRSFFGQQPFLIRKWKPQYQGRTSSASGSAQNFREGRCRVTPTHVPRDGLLSTLFGGNVSATPAADALKSTLITSNRSPGGLHVALPSNHPARHAVAMVDTFPPKSMDTDPPRGTYVGVARRSAPGNHPDGYAVAVVVDTFPPKSVDSNPPRGTRVGIARRRSPPGNHPGRQVAINRRLFGSNSDKHNDNDDVADQDGDTCCNDRASISANEFHVLSEDILHHLHERIEACCEDLDVDGFDAEYAQGVLTLSLGSMGTYVLNKQAPNRQIWLSSPISGPSRFDYTKETGTWVSARTGAELPSLLKEELSQLLGEKVSFK
ncbi:hypothetical protein CBR_g3856 [Chara braunii]|uniref:ferroxidase n=1 Tax=Chara braunii TaxID=69332 RepID=A0A388KGK5_CHABU|nr:hypothetical protein CBR_g3856 [Chara braunii]|eukprot:GBG69156.1 hypothetical protein CBR_g3856 [Chara braunii]